MTFQERAIQAIQASGGRVTHQRLILLEILADLHDDIDAERLHQRAIAQDPAISLPTVYRTLHTLEAAQLITPMYVSPEHERKVYRLQNNDSQRFHFTCRDCGKVIPFQTALVHPLQAELLQKLGAEVTSFCMCVGGLCADCREKETERMTLDELESGQSATIRKIGGEGAVRRRLMDMGLIKGVTIEKVKAAPLGDPIDYLVRGYHLSLRKSEAQLVEIEKC
jgi:ferrous iron transport protein A